MCSAEILSSEKLLNTWKNNCYGTPGRARWGFCTISQWQWHFWVSACDTCCRSVTPQLIPETAMPWWYLELHPSLRAWLRTLWALGNVQLWLNNQTIVHWKTGTKCVQAFGTGGSAHSEEPQPQIPGIYSKETTLKALHFLEPVCILSRAMKFLGCYANMLFRAMFV